MARSSGAMVRSSRRFPAGAAVVVLCAMIGWANAETAPTEVDDASVKLPKFLSKELLSLFQPGQHSVANADGDVEVFEYQLFKPVMGSTDKPFPLIVWLHGHGGDELNNRNTGQLKYLSSLIFEDATHREKYPFFLLALQCPKEHGLWFPFGTNDQEGALSRANPGDVVVDVLDDLCDRYPIDRNRVSLIGLSSGASACWEMARRYPNRFCAMVPFSSGDCGATSDMDGLVTLPIWAFHCTEDPSASVGNVRNMIAEIQRAEGAAHLSEIPTASHHSWTPAFEHWDVLDWLLSQQRGHKSSVKFGGTPFAYTSFGIWLRNTGDVLRNHLVGIIDVSVVMLILALLFWEYSRGQKGRYFAIGRDRSIPSSESGGTTRIIGSRTLLFASIALTLAACVYLLDWLLFQPSVTIIR